MTFKFSFILASNNRKTGPIPVTRTSMESCPVICPFKTSGCYAMYGMVGMHWRKLNHKGLTQAQFIESLYNIPLRSIWRHNEAGDLLADKNGNIDANFLNEIVKANTARKSKGFTYTHHDMSIEWNRYCVRGSNESGFTVNLSSNNIKHADELKALKCGPVVVTVAPDAWENGKKFFKTPNGHTVIRCPAETQEITCKECGYCANNRRHGIIGFTAHGAAKNRVIAIVKVKE